MKKVVILGGGVGGVECAIHLRKYHFDVELVSDRDFLYIYPTSIWLPTGEAKLENVSIPLKDIAKAHGFKFAKGKVVKVDAEGFVFEDGRQVRDFDYLVVALGQSKLKQEGIEHTYSICSSPEETMKYKEKLWELLRKGSGRLAFGFGGNPKAKEAVRGGPVFELLFNVDTLLRRCGVRNNFDLAFFAPMPRPGERLGEKALKLMDYMFKKRNIKVYTGKRIVRFLPYGIELEDGTLIESNLTLFVSGGDGHPAIKEGNLPKTEAGFVRIDGHCKVEGLEKVYAIGDCASIEGPEWKAKQGHLTEAMARICARHIAYKEGLTTKEPETYHEHINILCLMDTGDGGALAYRSNSKALLLPMPLLGHWLKKAWGIYYGLSKLGKIPQIL